MGSRKFTQIPSIGEKIVKIGPVDTEIALLIVKKINKKKKLRKVKYVVRSASLLSRLNNQAQAETVN